MPTWSGWIIQFLNAAHTLNTPPNQTFMSEWASHDHPSCKNSPITLSTKVTGSSNCGATVTPMGHTQQYSTHQQAAHAFNLQIHVPVVNDILKALDTGNPFQISNRDPVVTALHTWGSPGFAQWYKNATGQGGTGGGGGVSGRAPDIMTAWRQLQHSINKDLPHAVKQSRRMTQEALRELHRSHKVRH